MTTKLQARKRAAATPPRFPKIGLAAAALGVDRSHLWRVLTGRRRSRSLSARYAAWKGAGHA